MWAKQQKYKKKNSLAVKIFCVLLVFVVAPLYVVALFVLQRYEQSFRKELSGNITSSLAKSEQDIEQAFNHMMNMANVFCLNLDLQKALEDATLSYYKKVLVFDSVVRDITLHNLSFAENVQITMLDAKGNVYSNWSLDFRDYSFLQEQEIFKNEVVKKGNAVWEFFKSPYIYGDSPSNKYISLTRGMVTWNLDTYGEYLSTISISMRQSELNKVLNKYLYSENDYIVVANEKGDVLLRTSTSGKENASLDQFVMENVNRKIKIREVENIKGKKYLVSNYTITKKWIAGQRTINVYHFTDYSPVVSQVNNLASFLHRILIFCLFIVVLIVGFLSWFLVKPIRILANTMTSYKLEETYSLKASLRRDEIGLLNTAFIDMDIYMKKLFLQLERENKIKEQYKLNFLRAQLNPHFLFNTLGTVRWMAIAQNIPSIVECIDALGNMLKYSMNKGEEMVTLEEELENLENYIKIQNYRYGNRYKLMEEVPSFLKNCMLIRFLLQPVIENTIIHGFSETKGEGEITITAWEEGDTLFIKIKDNGKGIPLDILEKLNNEVETGLEEAEGTAEDEKESKQFNKIGVKNVCQQIKIRYGENYGVEHRSDGENGVEVIYKIPLLWDKPKS